MTGDSCVPQKNILYLRNIGPNMAIDELHISMLWMAHDFENGEIDRCRKEGIAYAPFRYANSDTCKQLLARATIKKWTRMWPG